MIRLACILLVIATLIGALMPSTPKPKPARADTDILYTPQSSGSSYRIVDDGQGQGSDGSSRTSEGALHLLRAGDGHFYVDARVNGMPVHFLVDTGASGIALSRSDAQTAGVRLEHATGPIGEGASGAVTGQWVRLDSVEVGPRRVDGVEAVVLDGGSTSLLGQSFLREFGSVNMHGDEMVLR